MSDYIISRKCSPFEVFAGGFSPTASGFRRLPHTVLNNTIWLEHEKYLIFDITFKANQIHVNI